MWIISLSGSLLFEILRHLGGGMKEVIKARRFKYINTVAALSYDLSNYLLNYFNVINLF